MIRMKLHILLAQHRMTQTELSQKTGIGKNTITAYTKDNCKHIVKEHLDILCKFFNCQLTDLIEYLEDTE